MNKFYIISCVILFIGCTKIEEFEKPKTDEIRAIVVNEGQFGYGTASLTSLSYESIVEQDVFRKINNRPMGDVAQSLTKINDRYYVPMNNSRKIEVFDSKTFQSVEIMPISENVIPMYLTHLGGDSVVVSDQKYPSKLMIMDINHGTEREILRRYISIPGRTFQMQTINGKLFVGGDVSCVFDLSNLTDKGMRALKTKDGSNIQTVDFSKIVVDKNGNLWVLGHVAIFCIDPVTEQTIHEIYVGNLNINTWVSCIDISPDKETIYFNSSRRVYKMDVDNPVAPETPIISPVREDGRTVYNMSVSNENTVFFAEVLYGSISRALIYEYNTETGEEVQNFKAGIFPHFIYFTN